MGVAAGVGWSLPLGAVLAAFLTLPLVGLVASTSVADFMAGLRHPSVWPALKLSLVACGISLALTLTFGSPLAWRLARNDGRLARTLEALLQLPIVVPPAVAGIALLLAFGRRGLLSRWLYPEGFSLAFTSAAVVGAALFVSAPLFVQSAISAFRRLDEELLIVGRTLGASPARLFFDVALPLSAPALRAGAALTFARALGEFGATLMFAGNLSGRTQTLPLAIYTALESDVRAAQALSLVLVLVSLLLLLVVKSGFNAALPRARERR